MRALFTGSFAILALLAGCQDLIGLGGSCAGEMQTVRRAEGSPDRNPRTQVGGDYTEQWVYLASGGESGRVYTFRWGTSHESCEMSGPVPLNVIPEIDPLAARGLPGARLDPVPV
jgi:hypothetical protein